MRAFVLLLSVAAFSAPAASTAPDDKIVVATGGWSEPVNGLRGRLVIAQGRALRTGARESLAYVELEHAPPAHGGPADVYFDPDALRCEMKDAAGKAVPQAPVVGSGGRPGKTWVALPFDSSARLRANPYAHGRAGGVFVLLNTGAWLVPDGGEAFLSGVLTVTPPADRPAAWKGELRLPAARIAPPAR